MKEMRYSMTKWVDAKHEFCLQVNHIRNKYHINVHGTNTPDPIETFDQLIDDCGIPQQIVNNLISCGYKEPTPIQMQAIPIMTSVSLHQL